MPDEVTLTPQEAEAATSSDFFLAVVSGLEEGQGTLRVRFIFNPLANLTVRVRGDVTLCGIRDVQALEYIYASASDQVVPIV